ncbi:MFS transporter [Massilia sp. CF038]|uniref:MFS transporter n=1 Tax=Massilia sp. CF038 TaxID=1881045 RepID=UPI00091F40B0|nr:MFS transporter [Massilia sp. CF038]SHH67306.1 Predicted arabinose efflux permease, MFS family [Massilia sp. CF038]
MNEAVLPPKRERMLLWLLAFTQFTVIMDFMIMMPLAPQLMRAFAVDPAAISGAVSVYAWCAGLSGLFAATYIDRFSRKRLMLTMFCLFTVSNLACALAPTFDMLLLSRAFAGLTGGVLSSISMAIIGDVIPPQRRGAAAGIVMTSFGMAAVAGVPAGVLLGAHYNWSAPFLLLVLLSAVVWCGAALVMPRLDAHLAAVPRKLADILPDLLGLFKVQRQRDAFLLSGTNMLGGMMIIPFIAPTLVGNLGVQPADMSWIYLAGGAVSLLTSRWLGGLADRVGALRMFRVAVLWSIVPFLLLTHLVPLPMALIVLCFVLFMTSMAARNIPMQALLTTIPAPAQRGAFLSVNSAIQQLGTGLGAWIGGQFLISDSAGHISHYGTNGWIAAGLALFGAFWALRLRPTRLVAAPA